MTVGYAVELSDLFLQLLGTGGTVDRFNGIGNGMNIIPYFIDLCSFALIFTDDPGSLLSYFFRLCGVAIIGQNRGDAEFDVAVGYAVELSDFFLKLLGAGSAVNA